MIGRSRGGEVTCGKEEGIRRRGWRKGRDGKWKGIDRGGREVLGVEGI